MRGTLSVMHGYRPDTYGESFADVYDDWYRDVSDIDATVAKISTLAKGGAVLELGVGTGRLALPLAKAGVEIVGIDSSRSMIDRLASKPGADAVTTVVGDMAELPFGSNLFTVAFAAFNTFFNLTTVDAQQQCVTRLADVVCRGGRLVIEGFVPPADGLADDGTSVRDITLNSAVLTVSKHDPDSQRITGQHIEISSSGVRMRPWMLRYLTPPQLDDLVAGAGFVLESRHGGWQGEPFDPTGDLHVSTYLLAK